MTILRTTSGLRVREPFTVAPDRHRRRRNGFAILSYNGKNGSGKTTSAVYDCLPFLAAGRPVVSTARILDPVTGQPHPLWVPLDDLRILLELRFCVALLDEVTGVASSVDHASMPSVVVNHIQQLRKDDVFVKWTTPNWKRADNKLREVTQGLVSCSGWAPVDEKAVTDDGLEREWRQRRGHTWRTYDAQNFDDWTTAKEKSPNKAYRLKAEDTQRVWGPGMIVRDMFDTYEHALSVGAAAEGGMCLDCGGKKPRVKPCRCDDTMPNENHDPSPGMLHWRMLHARRLAWVKAGRTWQEDFLADPWPAAPSNERSTAVEDASPVSDDTDRLVLETAV